MLGRSNKTTWFPESLNITPKYVKTGYKFLMLGRKHSSPTSHGLLPRRDHNQDWLSIETRMEYPTTNLASFLAKSTCVAEKMSCKITC
jgi:hypothetical protein